ncbi:MAG: hypothetical protein D3903_05150, partial [Candidatus Electrothrix sp. GM3_4]|nr:hypothetical protein [Candidatus Electrothrix sp. GM3_4]
MIKKIAFALLFSLGINSLVLAENTTISHSPFGFTPAAVIPPFQYGLNNPYTFAEDLGVKWDRSTNFVWTRIQPDLTTEQYHWMHERQ